MLDVLLVEDDADVRHCITSWLEDAGHRVTQASDGGSAASLLETRVFDVAICDVHLPTLDGLTLARRARHLAPETAVVMMSSEASVEDALSSLRDGALDYVVKPFDPHRLVDRIIAPIAKRLAFRKQLEAARAGAAASAQAAAPAPAPAPAPEDWVTVAVGIRIVAASPQMKAVVDRLRVVAQSDSSVLLHGEKGTGKKTLARLIHEESPRRLGPFVIVPSATLAGLIIESEHRALSSIGDRDAWFARAEGGTLVLDGVDQIPMSVQSALARVLAEPSWAARRSPGVDRAALCADSPSDDQPRGVRVVAIAETDLSAKVESGAFLEPLFYRLSAAATGVAPLRQRKADLLPLVAGILSSLAAGGGRTSPPSIEPEAYAALAEYPFPGNVSELVWALKYAFLMADASPIDVAHLPQRLDASARLSTR